MRKFLYFVIVVVLFFGVDVMAKEASISLACNKESLKKGEATKCELTATISSDITVNNFEVDITKDIDLTISFEPGQGWSGNLAGNRLVLTNQSGVTGNNRIGYINVRVSDTASFGDKNLNLTNVKFTKDGDIVNASSVFKIIKVISTNNDLKNIKIDDVLLENFDKDTLTYNLSSDNAKIKISAEALDEHATIEGVGEKNLQYGSNTFEIKVTSQSGSLKTYKINVTRNDNRSNENTLRSLTIEGYSLVFDKNKLSYNINVESTVEKVVIKSALTDSKASYVEGYGNREVTLEYGENPIEIKVKAENEEIRTYTINVNREDDRSDLAVLESLSINGEIVDLKEDLFTYGISLKFKHTKTVVDAKVTNKATIDYKDINLNVGDNQLIITVTSEKGTKNEYKIIVKRLTEEESRVAFENIEVENYNLNFTKSITEYELKIANDVNKLNIIVNPAEEEITKTIRGNDNLINDSVITINIKDDFGEYTYTIKIIKDTNNLILGFLTIDQICYIIFVIGGLAFIGALIHLIKAKKKK